MRIEKILYQKIFPTGMAYLNHKIGVEVQVEENDDWEEAFDLAKKFVDEMNTKSNPGMAAAMEMSREGLRVNPPEYPFIHAKLSEDEKPIRDTVDNIIEDINSCKDGEILQTYKFIAKKDPRLQEAFDKKLKSFQ